MERNHINFRTVVITALSTFAAMLILLYAPSPFVVTKPGIAVSTEQFVSLANGQALITEGEVTESGEEEGDLLLTAVMLDTPNLWRSIGAMFEPSYEVSFKADVLGGASIDEYSSTVKTMMKGSHQNALEAAYRYLDVEYSIQSQQITVQQVNHQALKPTIFRNSDVIVAGVDNEGQRVSLQSIGELADWLRAQNHGKTVQKGTGVFVQRADEEVFIDLDDIEIDNRLPDEQMLAKALVVNSFVELRDIIPTEEQYKLTIETDNIGGPSAGLVFALTIIDKLTEGDITGGSKIAATGTIDAAGNVGAIGGIVQKVYTTNKEGVELFLVPKGNEKSAQRTLKKIKSNMQIVGVSSLKEAIEAIASFQAEA